MGKDAVGRVSPRAITLPRLYAILDAGVLARQKMEIGRAAEQLRDAGVTLLQYRDKIGSQEQILHNAKIIDDIFFGVDCTLVLNDDPALAVLAGWNAVHVGQGDTAVREARKILLRGGLVGCSTHNDDRWSRPTPRKPIMWLLGLSSLPERRECRACSGAGRCAPGARIDPAATGRYWRNYACECE